MRRNHRARTTFGPFVPRLKQQVSLMAVCKVTGLSPVRSWLVFRQEAGLYNLYRPNQAAFSMPLGTIHLTSTLGSRNALQSEQKLCHYSFLISRIILHRNYSFKLKL
eukprot:561885-Amphidinium_carterae.1